MNIAAGLKAFRLRQSFERSRTSPPPGAAAGKGGHAGRHHRDRDDRVPALDAGIQLERIDVRGGIARLRGRGDQPARRRGLVHHLRRRLLRGLRNLRRVRPGPARGRAAPDMHGERGRTARTRERVHADSNRVRRGRRRPGAGSRLEETPFGPGLGPRHRVGQRLPEPRDAGLDRGDLRPDRGRYGVSVGEGPTTGHGHRLCGGGRPLLVQGASTSRIPRAREKGPGRDESSPGRLRARRPLARERLGRIPRVRKRVRGDRTPPGRGGRAPTSRRRRRAATRRRPRGRRAIVAVHPERDGGRGGPGGKPVTKVGVIGAGMTLFRRRLQETGKEMCFEATKMALDSAGLTRGDVDMVVCGTAPDAFDGVAMKGEYLLDGSGGYRKPYTRVFTGGGTGVFSTIAGWWHVASGLADVVL